MPSGPRTHPTRGVAPANLAVLVLTTLACDPSPDSDDGVVSVAAKALPTPASAASADGPPPPGSPGGHALTGQVQVFESTTAGAADLCVALVDPEPRALGGEAQTIDTTTTDTAGRFAFRDLPTPPTVGFVVVVDACGDATTWMPTGTPLPGERIGGRGAGDDVEMVAWLVPTAVRDDIDTALEASGSSSFIGDSGGMIGHSLASDGSPNEASWVRGPNSTQLWYARSSGTYVLYENTEAATGALYVAPDAEDVFGVWVTRVSGGQFEPLLGGGLPGVLLVWDFVSWAPRSAL